MALWRELNQAISNETYIEKLKEALQEAILNTNRINKICIDSDPAAYNIDWSDQTKEWAELCDLDLEKHNPFHFY